MGSKYNFWGKFAEFQPLKEILQLHIDFPIFAFSDSQSQMFRCRGGTGSRIPAIQGGEFLCEFPLCLDSKYSKISKENSLILLWFDSKY